METAQPKRPIGMTILLTLSLINACMQIFSNFFMFVTAPILKGMMESGELEDSITPMLSAMDETMAENFSDMLELWTNIPSIYFLITGLLFIGSLFGVIKMFKLQRVGFHCYSISQILILIASVAFIYSHMPQNTFFSDFLTTAMFILIYHLYFKRIENDPQTQREQDI
jgi:hypothetical protein